MHPAILTQEVQSSGKLTLTRCDKLVTEPEVSQFSPFDALAGMTMGMSTRRMHRDAMKGDTNRMHLALHARHFFVDIVVSVLVPHKHKIRN